MEVLDNYEKTKKWLTVHVHKNFFSDNMEFNILKRLLDRHPSKKTWKNQNPTSFKISRSPGNGSLVLYVRFDGLNKYRIVSWVACAKGKLAKHQQPDNNENKLNGAMRYAVRVQISKYRKIHPDQKCTLCNTEYRIEVDYYPTHFVDLKEDFIKMKSSKNEPPPTDFKWHPKRGNFMFKNGTKNNEYYEKKWKQAWQRYHNKHASYRYLCSTCNKKTNRKIKSKNFCNKTKKMSDDKVFKTYVNSDEYFDENKEEKWELTIMPNKPISKEEIQKDPAVYNRVMMIKFPTEFVIEK